VASAAVGSAGAVVAIGWAGAEVGCRAGASVAPPQAVSKRLIKTNTNSKERTNLVISIFSFYFYVEILSVRF
jgi:hypothetical protein